jgi:hypothetical protein
MPLGGISTKQCIDPHIHSYTLAVSSPNEIGIKLVINENEGPKCSRRK